MNECKQCGWELEEDEMFCPECGTDQRSEVRGQKIDVGGSAVADVMADRQPSSPKTTASHGKSEISDHDSRIEPPDSHTHSSPPITNNQEPITEAPEELLSECDDLTIYFNVARVLIEDASMPFEFRILPKRDGLDHLKVTVSNPQGMKFTGSLRRSLKAGKERKLAVDMHVPAGRRGMLTFDVAVEYRNEGRPCRYECIWRAEVYPREAQAIQNLVIDIKQQASEAGDVGGTYIPGLEKLAQRGDWRAVLSELAKVPPQWKELALEECGGFNSFCAPFDCRGMLSDPPSDAKAETLTLETGGKKIHLLSGDKIQLGRNRDSDITTRIFDEACNMPRDENLYISKFHCGFVKKGTTVKIQDGSVKTNSPKGKTWVNGKHLSGSMLLPSGPAQISFGQPGSPGRLFSLNSKLLLSRSEDGMSVPAGILLKRNDHVPECYLIVYDRVPLKALGSDWDGWCVARHKDGFCFGKETACKWLTPGSREFADAKMVEVKAFEQWGL